MDGLSSYLHDHHDCIVGHELMPSSNAHTADNFHRKSSQIAGKLPLPPTPHKVKEMSKSASDMQGRPFAKPLMMQLQQGKRIPEEACMMGFLSEAPI